MQNIIQCLQLLYVLSSQIWNKTDIQHKSYEQKDHVPKANGIKNKTSVPCSHPTIYLHLKWWKWSVHLVRLDYKTLNFHS